MADSIPLHVFSTQGGVIVEFIHDDLNRQSYNKVRILDINKIFSKPGSATDTLQFVENGEPFFLQDTAIKRVGKYFYTASKGELIQILILLTRDHSNNTFCAPFLSPPEMSRFILMASNT